MPSASVTDDQVRVDALRVTFRQFEQERPGELERLLDCPSLVALVDDRALGFMRATTKPIADGASVI